MRRLAGLLFAASVVLAAAYAFSPRPVPDYPAAGLRTDRLLLLDAARAGTRIVAVGERGRIVLSDDDGSTWREARSPTEALLTAVHFADGDHGWAVGHDSVILRTTDAGATWRIVHAAPEAERPLLDVWFRDARHGIAIGAYGAYLETSDGGTSWMPRSVIEGDRHLNAIAANTAGRLFIAGETGLLLASEDGGVRWRQISTPYAGSYFGLLATDRDALIVFGLRGNVFVSGDLGRNWRRAAVPDETSLAGGVALGSGVYVLAGQDGTLFMSRDGGASFTARRDGSGASYSAVLRGAGADLLAFGDRGVTRIPGVVKP